MIAASDAYSANMRANLLVANHTLALGEVGPNSCMVREPIAVAPGRAQIVLRIEEKEFRRDVFLVDGIGPDSQLVRYRELAADER